MRTDTAYLAVDFLPPLPHGGEARRDILWTARGTEDLLSAIRGAARRLAAGKDTRKRRRDG